MIGSYITEWVFASFIVATIASYTALKTLGRIRASSGIERQWWLAGGALSMGVGIWSMHFVGMLAFRLPIPLGFDPLITLISLLLAIAASAHALSLVSRDTITPIHMCAGAVVMGLGIAAMHYVGMGAMLMDPTIEYRTDWLIASIVIAILASGTALFIAYRLRDDRQHRKGFLRIVASVVMGTAIVGMHYSGMAAAQFPEGSICRAATEGGLSPDMLGGLVLLFNFAVLGTAISITTLDHLLHERTAALSDSLKTANRQLQHLASHDPLTGLPNRRRLIDELQKKIQRNNENKKPFALLFIDLDGFKGVNDAFGHHAGDLLLERVACALTELLRNNDMAARLGGDEFVVICDINTPDDGIEAAERILKHLGQVLHPDGTSVGFVTASIGIALYPEDGQDANTLLVHADTAMYASKQEGPNGAGLFTNSMRRSVQEQAQRAHELRLALQNKELILHYQPISATNGQTIVGMEALLRWNHPRLGLLLADQFIGLSEELGLITDIGNWVIDEACRQWAQWRDLGIAPQMISVNLSLSQLKSANLTDTIQKALLNHHVPPHVLTMELTESLALNDPQSTSIALNRIAELGVRISIDDFGSGYTSLAHLANLPVDELKIDRAFIKKLHTHRRHRAIVRSVVQLAHELGLEAVAEGVENAEQAQWLANFNCTRLQGWHISPARTAEQITEFLESTIGA